MNSWLGAASPVTETILAALRGDDDARYRSGGSARRGREGPGWCETARSDSAAAEYMSADVARLTRSRIAAS